MINTPLIGFGQVRHTRLRPALNRFAYPTYFLMLPMRALRAAPHAALARNRFALISFADRDHGDARGDSLAWLDEVLQREGIDDATGEVWLHCYPRVLGHTFKPVSFWYCHRADGGLAAIVVEVNNTFGERHCYLLDAPALEGGVPGGASLTLPARALRAPLAPGKIVCVGQNYRKHAAELPPGAALLLQCLRQLVIRDDLVGEQQLSHADLLADAHGTPAPAFGSSAVEIGRAHV